MVADTGAPTQLLATPDEACEMLRIGRTKLAELTRKKTLPSLLIGACRRYRVADLEAWILQGCPSGSEQHTN